MELLASVHWVATHAVPPARSHQEAVTAIHQWNQRKAKAFGAEHIRKAWEQLAAQGWIASPAMRSDRQRKKARVRQTHDSLSRIYVYWLGNLAQAQCKLWRQALHHRYVRPRARENARS
jgi:hypothetical protein